jgi:predicted transcriptional regulator
MKISQKKLNNAYYMLLLLGRKQVQRIIESINVLGSTGVDILIKCRTMDQPTISKYLNQLESYKIVYSVREGKFIRYYKNNFQIAKINNALAKAKKSGVIS